MVASAPDGQRGPVVRVSPKLDEDGNKVKNSRFVVYDRETFASDKDVPESLGAGKFERLKALAGLRDLLKKLNLESADEAADVMGEPLRWMPPTRRS